MIKSEVIRKRLNALDVHMGVLRRQQAYSFDAFVSDPERYGSVERFLQLSIEILIDLGNHVVADEGLGVVNWHSDIPVILAESGYIDDVLKERWIQMIGFRNILVHAYLEIDRRIVYDVLQNQLDDIAALSRVFAELL
jgi:uncharacterized protein YutE (UPF0331/DUF86 family)